MTASPVACKAPSIATDEGSLKSNLEEPTDFRRAVNVVRIELA